MKSDFCFRKENYLWLQFSVQPFKIIKFILYAVNIEMGNHQIVMVSFALINNVMSKYPKIQIDIDDINVFCGCLVIIARLKTKKAIRAVPGITWFLLQLSIFFRWDSRTPDMRSPFTFSTSHNSMISCHRPVASLAIFHFSGPGLTATSPLSRSLACWKLAVELA